MSFYPQIGSGSIAQFPLQRSRKWRMIVNELEDGEQVVLPDLKAGEIDWKLSYSDLADTEVQNLNSLFTAMQGQFGAFTFIDPLANLLAWSEDFTKPAWQVGLLQTQTGIADPLGTQRASSVANGTTGTQAVAQTLGISGDYVTCFSLWVRSSSAGTLVLQRDSAVTTITVRSGWNRVYLNGTGTAGATQSTFSVTLAPGQTVDIWGPQVEAQPYPSAYRQTVAARGIYEETYFGSDALKITSEAPGLSSCTIALTSRV